MAVSAKDLDQAATAAQAAGRPVAALAQADPALLAQVREGKSDLYSMRLVDTEAEDGDVVLLLVDGKPLGHILLFNRGTVVTVPVGKSKPTVLTIQAEKDGGGGVTFGMASSQGQVLSRVMQVGENETWSVVAR